MSRKHSSSTIEKTKALKLQLPAIVGPLFLPEVDHISVAEDKQLKENVWTRNHPKHIHTLNEFRMCILNIQHKSLVHWNASCSPVRTFQYSPAMLYDRTSVKNTSSLRREEFTLFRSVKGENIISVKWWHLTFGKKSNSIFSCEMHVNTVCSHKKHGSCCSAFTMAYTLNDKRWYSGIERKRTCK